MISLVKEKKKLCAKLSLPKQSYAVWAKRKGDKDFIYAAGGLSTATRAEELILKYYLADIIQTDMDYYVACMNPVTLRKINIKKENT